MERRADAMFICNVNLCQVLVLIEVEVRKIMIGPKPPVLFAFPLAFHPGLVHQIKVIDPAVPQHYSAALY